MAEAAGIEPANNRVKICCLSRLATLLGGTGYWNRTNASWFRARYAAVTPILYVVGRAGFEPAAFPMSLIYSQFPSPFGYLPMCASRLDFHALPATKLRKVLAPHFPVILVLTHQAMQFSAGIVFLCEDLRDSHIIRERPGSWHRRKGLEPSSGGFGDRCSAN